MILSNAVCSKCGTKFKIIETRYNDNVFEIYRHRKCTNCGDECFTVEKVANENEQFKRRWNRNARAMQEWRMVRKEIRRQLRIKKSLSASGAEED